ANRAKARRARAAEVLRRRLRGRADAPCVVGCAGQGWIRARRRGGARLVVVRGNVVSRAYRVAVRGSVRRVVHVEDGVCTELELLPIVSRERTSELLAADLAQRGFTVEAATARRAEADGVVVEIDLASGVVSVKAEANADIAVDKEQTAIIDRE